jgi:hypothetical protein
MCKEKINITARDEQGTHQFQPASSKFISKKSPSFMYLTIKSVLASLVFVKKIHFKGTVKWHGGGGVSGVNR